MKMRNLSVQLPLVPTIKLPAAPGVWSLFILSFLFAASIRADDISTAKGEAPPDTTVLKSTPGGAFFVAKPLKQAYDNLLREVRALQADMRNFRTSGADALRQLTQLQEKLDGLRKEIEAKKVLVSAARVHVETETKLFRLGPEQLLVITADNLRVEGWEGPAVKCVFEKTVFAADDKPVDEHLKGLQLVHKHGANSELVGQTKAERQASREADEQKFLAGPDGQKLNEEQREARRKLLQESVDSHHSYYAPFREFQGKEIDTLEIGGLTYQEGNRQIGIHVQSPGGDGRAGNIWQRHAALTVYVPPCQSIALRGCLAGFDVTGVHAALIVTSSGEHDRDYDASFRIRDLHGSLTVDNAPLDLVESIRGNVTITSTIELVNSGGHSDENQRVFSTLPPRETICRNIDGDLNAWFMRADLKLSNIAGEIDVRNEYGDTFLAVGRPLAEKPHRLLSESGRIEVRLTAAMVGQLPMQAVTNCGAVGTNAPPDFLDATYASIAGESSDRTRREWRGVWTKNAFNRQSNLFNVMQRLNAALTGADRSAGFDVISRSGTVIVTVGP